MLVSITIEALFYAYRILDVYMCVGFESHVIRFSKNKIGNTNRQVQSCFRPR